MAVREAKPEPHPSLEAFLSSPIATFGLADLPKLWRVTRITFIFERPPDLDDGMRLPAAIRGALGEPLKAVSSERYKTDAAFGTPFQAFYADNCQFEERWHVPKPFVIWCRSEAGALYVEMSLFGETGIWRDDVIEAMLRVMTPETRGGEGGISLMAGHRARRIWKLRDVFWRESGYYPVPPIRRPFLLASKTPFVMSSQQTMKGGIPDLLFSIFARIAGLSRWHGFQAGPDLAFPAIRAACSEVRSEVLFKPHIKFERRTSRTFRGHGRLETGLDVCLLVRDFPEALWPGFVLGTLTHAGYDVVHGYGRYAIGAP